MTNSNVLTPIVPAFGALATNPSELTDDPHQTITDPTDGMDEGEARTWARTITERLRDQAAEVIDAQLTYTERRDAFVITMKEATVGAAWRRLGYATWDAWVAGELTADRIYRSIDEKHDLIDHLRANGFSQAKIAPLVDMTRRGVGKYLSQSKSVQEGTRFPPAQTDKTGTAPAPAADSSGQADRKTEGLDGKEYAPQRSRAQLTADWLYYRALADRNGWSPNRIAQELGVPRRTVYATLDERNRPKPYEHAVYFLKARTTLVLRHGTMSEACDATGLRMEAVEWLLDEKNKPAFDDLLEPASVTAWRKDNKNMLRLADGEGTAVTQAQFARIYGRDQGRISQLIGVSRTKPGTAGQDGDRPKDDDASKAVQAVLKGLDDGNWDRPVGAGWRYDTDPSLTGGEDMAATRLTERYRWRNRDILDYGCGQLLEAMEDHILQVDPTDRDAADVYYDEAGHVVADAMPRLLTVVNILSTYAGVLDDGLRQDLYTVLRGARAQLDRNLDAIEKAGVKDPDPVKAYL